VSPSSSCAPPPLSLFRDTVRAIVGDAGFEPHADAPGCDACLLSVCVVVRDARPSHVLSPVCLVVLSEMLGSNLTLTHLGLEWNEVGLASRPFAKGLAQNTSLQVTLRISHYR
jgi:hypothetical protein